MFDEEIKFLTALANGVNIFTGEKCAENSILNDTNVIRTLFNICERLRSVNIKPLKQKKDDYNFDDSILDLFPYTDAMPLTNILRRVSDLYPNMKKVSYKTMYEILESKGMLYKAIDKDGTVRAFATDLGGQKGIINVEKISHYGKPFNAVSYTPEGQRYVLTLLSELNTISF